MNFLYLKYIFKTSCRIDGIDGSEDNWESGNTDNFVGDELGHCDGFLISDKDLDTRDYAIKLYHHGMGGVKIDWVELGFDLGRHLRCKVDSDMDNDQTSDAKECYYI